MKMTAKAVKRGAAVLVLAAVFAAAWYHFSYPIELNLATLPEEITAFLDHGAGTWNASDIRLYDGVELGNRVYVLLETGMDMELGRVILERGPLGGYRIGRVGYGGGNFLDGIVESEGKKYLLLGGRDVAARITRIEVPIEGRTYELENPNPRDHFLLCAEIDSRTEDNHVDRDKVRFYSADGEDITGLYDLSGGGI